MGKADRGRGDHPRLEADPPARQRRLHDCLQTTRALIGPHSFSSNGLCVILHRHAA